jgi:hypothetical protein
MIARFDGRCAICGKPIPKGSEMRYENKRAYHPDCVESEAPDIDEANRLADKLGFTKAASFVWEG